MHMCCNMNVVVCLHKCIATSKINKSSDIHFLCIQYEEEIK